MLVAVKTPTPSLPITSRQLQHLQAVTHSFAQWRPIISFVFNNFRTLSVATGWYPFSCQGFRGFRLGGFRSPSFHAVANCSSFQNDLRCPARFLQFDLPFRSMQTNERLHRVFRWKKCEILTWRRPHSMLYFAIQCTETPFGERFGAIPPTPVD